MRTSYFGADFNLRSDAILKFIGDFRKLHKDEYASKAAIQYCTPAAFHDREEGIRWKNNFRAATAITLDFDGGLSVDCLDDILWTMASAAEKIAFIAYSTFSHNEARNRFRAIVFLKRPIFTTEAYRYMVEVLIKRIVKAGISREKIALDSGCVSGNKCYVLPGRPVGAGKDWGFFITRGCRRQMDLERYCLDPEPYLTTATELEALPVQMEEPVVNELDLVRETLASLGQVAAIRKDRHDPLWDAMWKPVRRMGMAIGMLEGLCVQVFGSDPEMMKKVKDNLRTLSS